MRRLELLQAAEERVVLGVRDLRRVELVVALVVMDDLAAQALDIAGRRSRTPSTTRSSAACRSSRRRIRRSASPGFADGARRRAAGRALRDGAAHAADAVARERDERGGGRRVRQRVRRALRTEEPVAYVAEPKLDGLSRSSSSTRAARLVVGSTRGDGTTGEDVTANLRTIRTVPARAARAPRRAADPAAARGSAPRCCSRKPGSGVSTPTAPSAASRSSRTRAQRRRGIAPASSTRGSRRGVRSRCSVTAPARSPASPRTAGAAHAAAGATRGRPATSVRASSDSASAFFATQWKFLETLRGGDSRSATRTAAAPTVATALTRYQELAARREELAHEIDGVVLKVDDLALQERLGQVSRSRAGRFAYKFKAQQAETKVLDIVPSVGRLGTRHTDRRPGAGRRRRPSPSANASLHNMDEIARKDVRVGDTILLERARRRDSVRRARDHRKTERPPAEIQDADRLSRFRVRRRRRSARRARRRIRLHQRRVPGAAQVAHPSLRVAQRPRHRRPRREARRPARRARPGPRLRRPLRARRRDARRPSNAWPRSRPRTSSTASSAARIPRSTAFSTRSASATSASIWRRFSPTRFRDVGAVMETRPRKTCSRLHGIGPEGRGERAPLHERASQSRRRRATLEGGVAPAPRRRHRPASLPARQSCSPARSIR